MKILHLTTAYKECGVSEYTNFLIQALSDHDNKLVRASEDFKVYLQDYLPDVIHIQWASGVYADHQFREFLHQARVKKIPILMTYHNDAPGLASYKPDRIFIHQESDRFIFHDYPIHQVHLIPHGIPQLLSDVSPEPGTFAMSGFLLHHKGVLPALEAFSDLCQIHYQKKLRLILSCPLHPPNIRYSQALEVQVRRKMQEYTNVDIQFYTDFVSMEELVNRLSPASAFLYPYISNADQASSAAITMAIGMGRPAIVSDVSIFNSIHKGVIRFPKDDIKALKRSMEMMLDGELHGRLFREMRELAGERSWGRVAEETVQVYQEAGNPTKPVAYQKAAEKWKNRRKKQKHLGNLLLVGNHAVPVSFSYVLVEMVKPLITQNKIEVCFKDVAPLCMRGLEMFISPLSKIDIELRYQYPPNPEFTEDGRKKVLMMSCEGSYAPPSWVGIANSVDKVLTPSTYSKTAFLNAGIDEKKIHVVPHGVDHHYFNPEGSNYDWGNFTAIDQDTFVFFSMAAFDYRKGIDILLDVFFETFTAKDNVVLALKNNSFQSIFPDIDRRIRTHGCAPKVALVEGEFPMETIASMMRSAHAGIFPYRGEGGFGLVPLEMIACGTPVIISNYGAPLEYATEQSSWFIPGDEIKMDMTNRFYDEDSRSTWFKPNSRALSDMMRDIAQNRGVTSKKGSEALQIAEQYTWERSADILAEVLG